MTVGRRFTSGDSYTTQFSNSNYTVNKTGKHVTRSHTDILKKHSILLRKLESVGASSFSALRWFKSYLTGRTQAVRIGTSTSCSLPITHGVPQGAILSPLLFTIYLNNLHTVIRHCSLESYVDDSKLFMSYPRIDMKDTIKNLEENLKRVVHWCCNNRLLINPDKTKVLLIGTRQMLNLLPQEAGNVNLMGKLITPSTSAKDLGVTIDTNLTYDAHISNIVSSGMSSLCQINRIKHLFNPELLETMINSLVFSRLFYCSSVWANTTDKNIMKLQLVQNFAARIILGINKYDHITPGLNQLQWLQVRDTFTFRDTLMTFKCINGLTPDYLANKFSKRSTIHNCNTRFSQDLNIPEFSSSTGQRSFAYRGAKIWNSLKEELKSETNFIKFKKLLKSSLLQQ